VFAVVQFPIADARRFAADNPLRLGRPSFPKPRTYSNPEFIKCLGPAVDRVREADPEWADEQFYCRADRALRFVNLPLQRLGLQSGTVRPSIAFRRLFSDGEAVSRIEIGIRNIRTRGASEQLVDLNGPECEAIALGLLSLPSQVRGFYEQSNDGVRSPVFLPPGGTELIGQGQRLARLYCHATAWAEKPDDRVVQERFVIDGRPLLIIELENAELQQLPTRSRLVEPAEVGGANLAFQFIQTPYGRIGTWYIVRHRANDEMLRKLRLCLLRLHAEREILHLIINQYQQGNITYVPRAISGDALESYVDRALTLVQRPVRHQVSQSAILEAFDAAGSVHPPADIEGLAQRYQGMKRQIKQKLLEYEQSRAAASRAFAHVDTYAEAIIMTGEKASFQGGQTDLQVGDRNQTQISGSVSGAQFITGGGGSISGTVNFNHRAAKELDTEALRSALNELYEAFTDAGLPKDAKRRAQTAIGNALDEGIENGEVNPERLLGHVESAGKALKDANVVVEEGKTLWESVHKVAQLLAPVVGAANTVTGWFT
jgi:hypothetical protein